MQFGKNPIYIYYGLVGQNLCQLEWIHKKFVFCGDVKHHPRGNIRDTTCLGLWILVICCSIGKILTSGVLKTWRDSTDCGDGKGLVGLVCDGEFDGESFELAGDFKVDAVTGCA